MWGEFGQYIERMIGLAGYAKSPAKTPAEKMLKELAGKMKESQAVCAAALGYGVLTVLRSIIGENTSGALAENLAFEHWGLDRKLREQYRIFGASNDEAWRLGEISKTVLSRTCADDSSRYSAAGDFNPESFAAKIIENNYLLDDFRRLIGINVYDDVIWYNKEAFESALFHGTLFYVLENDSAFARPMPWLDRAECIAGISAAMKKAEAASGYRIDNLIHQLAGNDKSPIVSRKGKAQKGKGKKE